MTLGTIFKEMTRAIAREIAVALFATAVLVENARAARRRKP